MRIKMLSLLLIIFFSFPYAAFAQEQQNNLSVTATVPAQAGDFVTITELSDPTNANFPQDTTLTYQITYGTTLSNSVNFTLVANWSLGTISGSGSPTVEIVDYVVGSATSGYGSATPVIDPVNRTITWTINSFPANTTNQTVTFKLATNNNYTGTAAVDFDISSLIQGPGVNSATSTITSTYQAQTITPTPTPNQSSNNQSTNNEPGTTNIPALTTDESNPQSDQSPLESALTRPADALFDLLSSPSSADANNVTILVVTATVLFGVAGGAAFTTSRLLRLRRIRMRQKRALNIEKK